MEENPFPQGSSGLGSPQPTPACVSVVPGWRNQASCRVQPQPDSNAALPVGIHPHLPPPSRYSEVFEVVSSFVSQAELEHPEAAAIMLLGTVKELAQHKDPSL